MTEPVKLLPCRCGAVLVSRQTTAPLDPSPETWWAHPPSECPLFCVGFPESKIPAWNAIMSPSPREAELEDALRNARDWLSGWASAENELAVIEYAIAKADGSSPAVSPESNTGQNVADETRGGHETN